MIDNVALFGKDETTGVVGVKLLQGDDVSDRSYVTLWRRVDGELREEVREFYPFFYLNDIKHLHGFNTGKYKFVRLNGPGYYNNLVVFDSWKLMWAAVKHVKERLNWKKKGYPEEMYIITNPEQQFLMQTGITFFKGLDSTEIHRCGFDIESYNLRGFPNASRADNKIFIITIGDNRGYYKVLHSAPEGIDIEHGERCANEAEILRRFVEEIRKLDPDTFEGHNIFSFDLPYIHERCKRFNVPFNLGRDGSEPEHYPAAMRFAERDIEYPAYSFAGRSVIDTLFLAMQYDVIKRDLPGYSLKVVAKHFGYAPEDRTYIPGDELSKTWDEDPAKVLAYAFDDVIETLAIGAHLGGSVFASARMIPMPYDRVARAGTATKIESLMVREYLRRKYALPHRDDGLPETIDEDDRNMEVGGYTDIYKVGVYDNIIYADVASLYPSIMIHYNVEPSGDTLKLFQNLLRQLTDLRLSTKDKMKEAEEKRDTLKKELDAAVHKVDLLKSSGGLLYATEVPDVDHLRTQYENYKQLAQNLDHEQASYKILINSFFGALGFVYFLFNDFKEADRVTVTGQMLLNMMIGIITEDGGQVVEVDTDGILAIPPPFVYTKGDDEAKARLESKYAAECEAALKVGGPFPPEPVDDETYVKSMTDQMPEGINIDFDGRAEVMMSYKKKNYALREIKKDGTKKVKIKGGSLVSRLVEPYRLEFVKETIHALLERDTAKMHEIYKKYWLKVVGKTWAVEEFAKTQTLKDPIELYKKKIGLGVGKGGRNKSAPYELAIRREEETGVKPQVGDRISYYTQQTTKTYKNGKVVPKSKSSVKVFEDCNFADDYNGDEHTEWYLDKLNDSADKFRVFFTEADFKRIFSHEDDPSFDYAAVEIQNKDVIRKPIRVIIAGGRDIEDIFWVKRAIAGCKFLKDIEDDVNPWKYVIGEVVSGKAPGVDTAGEAWAKENGIHVEPFPADWDNIDVPNAVVRTRRDGTKYNAIAGHIRNEQMAEYADALIAIWDGKSTGTKNMIDTARAKGLIVHVSKVKPTGMRDPK